MIQGPPSRAEHRWAWVNALSFLRSLLVFVPLLMLATTLCGAVSLALSLFDATGRRQHRVARFWAWLLLRLFAIRMQVEGTENLPPNTPCILVCNHLSFMDIPTLFAVLPLQFRIFARQGLFSIPFLGWHLTRSRHLPVDDSAKASLRSLLRAADTVRQGLPVFVFPEGGRSMDGRMQRFIPGAFLLAVRAQVPVVPMVLVGSRDVLPPGSLHLHPFHVTLTILPPVSTQDLTPRQAEALAFDVRERMRTVYETARPELATETMAPVP